MARATAKLSKTVVDKLTPGEKEQYLWDYQIPGFGVRMYPTGRKVYVLQYRTEAGETRKMKLGQHGPITTDSARKKAKELLGKVASGKDPSSERQQLRKDLTVAQLCDVYLAEGMRHKKASTIKTDTGRIERHIKPLLGSKRVQAVVSRDIEKFMRDVIDGRTAGDKKTRKHGLARVRGGKGTASRTVGLLGGIFSFAVNQGLCTDNPVRGVERPKDQERTRFLQDSEFPRLSAAMEEAERAGANCYVIGALKLLLLTGCRKSEVLTLRWDDVDLETGHLHLSDAKAGARSVALNKAAKVVLRDLAIARTSNYVFPSRDSGKHLSDLGKVWRDIRSNAGLDDVTIHDLRRSFGSTAHAAGVDIYMIRELLGHRDLRTTQIYVRVADKARQAASELTGLRITDALRVQRQGATDV